MINWGNNMQKGDYTKISDILNRFKTITGQQFDKASLMMDIEACHISGCELDFDKLLNFPDFDLCHDVAGISNNINRETGKLQNCFLPRCAV